MRGVFAIPPTPFRSDGALDERSLSSAVRFILEAGGHGVVAPVNASEFAFLTDMERQQVVDIAVGEVAGAVPVVAGVTGTCTEHALVFARHARRVGADAVLAMPPYIYRARPDQITDYFTALAREAQLPVFVQNHMPPLGDALPPTAVAQLVRDIDGVDYIKEECAPPGQYMSEELDLAGAALKGVMGGMGGRYVMEEYRRGACGTMPACEITDVHVELWNQLENGDTERAQRISTAMLPLLNLEAMHGGAIYKEVLYRRGVIASTKVRRPGRPELDQHDQSSLDAALEELEPYFKLKPPSPQNSTSTVAGIDARVAVKAP